MCVLASAVDIFLLTYHEAVISKSWSPPRFVIYSWPIRRLHARHTACVSYVRAGGVSTLYIAPTRWGIWMGINFYYLCSKKLKKRSIR